MGGAGGGGWKTVPCVGLGGPVFKLFPGSQRALGLGAPVPEPPFFFWGGGASLTNGGYAKVHAGPLVD